MGKSKELSLVISLALHLGGLSLLLYLGLDSYEEKKRTVENISVSIISVSEFDAHMSEDPNPSTHKLKLSNIWNLSESAHEPDFREVGLRDFELHESRKNEFKLAKLNIVKRSKIFSKLVVNHQIENPQLVSNIIKKIPISKNINMLVRPVTNQENKNFYEIDKSPEISILNHVSTQFLNPQSNEGLNVLRESLPETLQFKENEFTSSITNRFEESISSAWGSAIEQKVLSNLVYPKKARNKFLFGKVDLKLEIFSDGTILDVLIRRSSGHVILDKAAKAAVLRSLKLPAAPKGYPNKKFIFNLPIRFSV